MKKLILSILLLFVINTYSQVYKYNCYYGTIEENGTLLQSSYSDYFVTLNLNNEIVLLEFSPEDKSEYIILDYFKFEDDKALYFQLQNKLNAQNNIILSVNMESKTLMIYVSETKYIRLKFNTYIQNE